MDISWTIKDGTMIGRDSDAISSMLILTIIAQITLAWIALEVNYCLNIKSIPAWSTSS